MFARCSKYTELKTSFFVKLCCKLWSRPVPWIVPRWATRRLHHPAATVRANEFRSLESSKSSNSSRSSEESLGTYHMSIVILSLAIINLWLLTHEKYVQNLFAESVYRLKWWICFLKYIGFKPTAVVAVVYAVFAWAPSRANQKAWNTTAARGWAESLSCNLSLTSPQHKKWQVACWFIWLDGDYCIMMIVISSIQVPRLTTDSCKSNSPDLRPRHTHR